MSLVNWLVDQPWSVFLAIWLPFLAGLAIPFLAIARHRRPAEPEVAALKVVSDWDAHPHSCGCLCEGRVIYPCRGHKGRAAKVLHPLETK